MMLLNKENIDNLNQKNNQAYYVPSPLFDSRVYVNVRVEVKWAYVAVLNVMLKEALYDKERLAYVKDDSPTLVETLKKLANKRVDQGKIAGYLDELEDLNLVERQGRNIYLYNLEG